MINFGPKNLDLNDPASYGFRCHLTAEAVMELVARAVRVGIDDGSIRPELNPIKTAYLLWGQSAGIIQVIQRQGDYLMELHGIDPDELVPANFDLIYHALLRPES